MTLPIRKRLFSFDPTTTTNSTDKLVVEQGTEIKISTLDKVRIWLQGLFDARYLISSVTNSYVKSFLGRTGDVTSQSGDYTASMVHAVDLDVYNTLLSNLASNPSSIIHDADLTHYGVTVMASQPDVTIGTKENAAVCPATLKVLLDTRFPIATQSIVNAGVDNTEIVTALTLQKRNIEVDNTYSGTNSVSTSTINGLINYSTVVNAGTGQTYSITNSYFTSIPQARAAILNFSIKHSSSPTNVGLVIGGYFIDSSGIIYVRIYNVGAANSSSFQLYYNIVG